MKKLLILMLVLGMASMASAVVIEIDALNPMQVNLVGEDETVGMTYFLTVTGPGSIDAGTMLYTGNTAAITDFTGVDPDITALMDAAIAAFVAVNLDFVGGASTGLDLVEFQGTDIPLPLLTGLLASWIATDYVEVYQHSAETGDVLGAVIIPEPMTIALLGLGGLFLLRRRK